MEDHHHIDVIRDDTAEHLINISIMIALQHQSKIHEFKFLYLILLLAASVDDGAGILQYL